MIAGELNRLRDSGKRVTVTIRDIERSFRLKSVIHKDGQVFLFYRRRNPVEAIKLNGDDLGLFGDAS